ncbi:MAG: pantoate--beta-alanine ligase [Kiritimatiellales bacterium]|nr:pantoate--beta-alanine ligase [Kiritimatiellales bacterium]MCF7863158.1 pantoate--beta-alanine ligase [Kiritimatiellales bacterium]
MEIIRTPATIQQRALALKREGRVIGFVPTMGFLHAGHVSLMRLARTRCDVLAVSIFVNPTQFGPNEDLEAYPRDFAQDEILCAQAGVDLLFYPESGTMYAADASVWVDEASLSTVLCGASRIGHFRGVCTVVAKLFNLVLPDLAVFGEKDAQQLRIIERMVRDLNFPVEILRGAIVREADGLAMSSRNKYLASLQRKDALCLRRSLDCAVHLFATGERDAGVLRQAMVEIIGQIPSARIDYIEIVDDMTLASVERIERTALVALAVKIGSTRLIDNDVLRA